MERKIGEIFEFGGEWHQCVEGNDCANCVFIDYCKSHTKGERDDTIGLCVSFDRNDRMHVIFKKLEKVGDPFVYEKRICQTYKLHTPTNLKIQPDEVRSISTDRGNYTADIEIKQNKKDMEEKSLNLKPFDLEKAKQGKPVCTREGRKARIICFDKKCLNEQILIVLVDCGKEESIYFYTTDGKCIDDFSSFDLMMFPEKKEGWVNVYYDNATSSHRGCRFIYDTKEQAVERAGSNYITTIKIEWEE